ncbi:MAG: branched-chain amino acid ABC transporter substrate-binding protein [Paracoccaceae bacterium]|nr:MAG: ABC transporter substrate-binding protein [Alphaproteobacteria bacterium]GIX14891.1 MAG: branched-chain amino acid ABC transporter substrate-binding protein [Paracoccaceae bacterium]
MKPARIALAGALAALAMAASPPQARADQVRIGVVVAQTGTYAFVGAPLVNGIRLALDELRADPSGFGGHEVEVIFEDNRSDKQEAIALITRLATAEGVDLIIGPIATSEAMAAGPVANELQVPMFTTATSPAVLEIGPWIFKSTETADAYMAPVAMHVVEVAKPKTCFLVSIRDNEGYVRQRNVFRAILESHGVGIVADETILAADTDFTALATKIVDADPDCLFVTAPPETAANLIIQARQAGLRPDTVIAGDSGMGSQKFLDAGGRAVEGVLFPASFVAGSNELSARFAAAYQARYGSAPDLWAATGYTMMQVVANAIRNAGPEINRETLRAAMAATRDLPVVLGQGRLSFDENRVPHMGGIVMQIRDGAWVKP